MSYCTNEEVFERMGFADAVSPDITARVTDAIAAAAITINEDTHRSFLSTAATKELGVDRPPLFELRVPDLISVTTLKVDDDDDGVFETTIAASDYELDTPFSAAAWPFEAIRLLERDFPSGSRRHRRIEIVGTWGWSAIPAPINQAASILAARLAQRSVSAPFGIQSFGELGTQGIRSTDPDYVALIRPYIRPGIA